LGENLIEFVFGIGGTAFDAEKVIEKLFEKEFGFVDIFDIIQNEDDKKCCEGKGKPHHFVPHEKDLGMYI